MLTRTKSRRRTLALSIIPVCALGILFPAQDGLAQSADMLALPARKDLSQNDLPTGLLQKTRSSNAAPAAEPPRNEKSSEPETPSLPPLKPATSGRQATAEKPKASSTPQASSKRAAESPARNSRTEQATGAAPVSEADLALVAHLRPGISSTINETPEIRTELVSASPMNTRQARTAAPRVPEPPTRLNEPESDDETISEENSPEIFESEVAAAAVAAAPPPATVTPRTPNLYLPQATPQRSGGLLSRLFNRRNNNNDTVPAPVMQPAADFNSDYATRSGHVILPAVLQGNGLNGVDLPIGGEDAYRLTNSLPSTFRPTDLVCLPEGYCFYGNPLYLRQEAANSLCNMINVAAAEGMTLRVVSAYRDFNHQNRLYTRAVARHGTNQKRVARPGRSEHFLGTTVDLTNNAQHVLKRSFGDTPEGRWLQANAERFGWKLTVMPQNGRSPNAEPWHLRYMGGSINQPAGRSIVANPNSGRQRPDVFGSIGRALRLRR